MSQPASESLPKPRPTARTAREQLRRSLAEIGEDEALALSAVAEMPEAWSSLDEDVPCREMQERITLRLDASVVRFFRAMGLGYQRRINRVLKTYAQMRIGQVFELVERMETEDPDMAPSYRAALGLSPRKSPVSGA